MKHKSNSCGDYHEVFLQETLKQLLQQGRAYVYSCDVMRSFERYLVINGIRYDERDMTTDPNETTYYKITLKEE